jgi:GNAT superfamily N-acetyltransferase
VIVRPRETADLPVLADLLGEQQPTSRYPYRWPLPMPPIDFIARPTDAASWVAEQDGQLLGHVAVGTLPPEETEVFAAELGDRRFLAITALFTGLAARGRGAGAALHDRAVAHLREQGVVPVLDVLPTHAAALAMYERRGWRTIGTMRFPFLPDEAPSVRLMVLDPSDT